MRLNEFRTYELIEELKNREGVEVYNECDTPESEWCLKIINHEGRIKEWGNGPVIVMVIED